MEDTTIIVFAAFAALLVVMSYRFRKQIAASLKIPGWLRFNLKASNDPPANPPPGASVESPGTAQAQPPNLHQLPRPPDDFTGRTEDVKDLLTGVTAGGMTICCLQGVGGVGKTALALKAAQRLTPHFPDAQFYLDLKGASPQPLSPAEAMAHVIRSYLPAAKLPDGQGEMEGIYRAVLAGQKALLLMDDAADAEQVEPLIPPTTALLLVTSRNRFALARFVSRRIDTLPPDKARELLLAIAPRIGEHAETIAELCGHLPLALRLAASAIAERVDLAPADYAQRLRDKTKRLDLVDASLSLSYGLLTPPVQQQWSALTVFPNTFEQEAAAAVWDVKVQAAADLLSELLRLSLLQRDGQARRYRMHDLVRIFADSRLTDPARKAAHTRHAAHYKDVAASAQGLYLQGGAGVASGLALFDAEWPNIASGQKWAAANADSDDQAAALCSTYPDAGAHCLSLRQHPDDWIRWLQAALAAARRLGNRRAQGNHLGNLGNAYAALGETRRAIEFYERQLAITREIGDSRGEANSLWNWALALRKLGQAQQALAPARAALKIFEQIRDPDTKMVRKAIQGWQAT